MEAVIFLIDTLVGLYLFVLLARLLLQLTRADFRNPVARGIVQLTNPVILPLRRVLPAAGRIDTASVVAIVAIMAAKLIALYALSALPFPPALLFARALAVELLRLVLQTYFYAILLYAVLSFVAQGAYSPGQALLASLCEPLLRPIRRRIPAISGLDLSPLWAIIAIQALLLLIR
jgi:YggT family protein